MLFTTEVEVTMVVANVVVSFEMVIWDVTPGTKRVLVDIALTVEVLVMVVIGKVWNFEAQSLREMVCVVTGLIVFTHSTAVGYAVGEYIGDDSA